MQTSLSVTCLTAMQASFVRMVYSQENATIYSAYASQHLICLMHAAAEHSLHSGGVMQSVYGLHC